MDFVRQRMKAWKETLHSPVILDLNFVEPNGMGEASKVRRTMISHVTSWHSVQMGYKLVLW